MKNILRFQLLSVHLLIKKNNTWQKKQNTSPKNNWKKKGLTFRNFLISADLGALLECGSTFIATAMRYSSFTAPMFTTSQKKFSIFFNQKFFNKMNNFKEEFAGFERTKKKAKGEKPSKREKKDKEIERRNERKRVGR